MRHYRLYCTNLPDKLQKPDLRLSLYTLFSTYGPVLDVVALKTMKMRGQAHIVYRDIQASTQAMRALQGFDFFGKEMVRLHKFLHPMFIKPNNTEVNLLLENSIRQGKVGHHFKTRWHLSCTCTSRRSHCNRVTTIDLQCASISSNRPTNFYYGP